MPSFLASISLCYVILRFINSDGRTESSLQNFLQNGKIEFLLEKVFLLTEVSFFYLAAICSIVDHVELLFL